VSGVKPFICHSSADKDVVRRLAGDLRQSGIEAWFDEWEIRPGDSIIDKINEGISGCEVFIVVISRNSVASRWVREELNAAVIRRIRDQARLIPVRLDNSEVPALLSSLKHVDLSRYEAGLRELVEGVAGHDSRPPLGRIADNPRLANPYNLSDLALRLGKWLLDQDTDGLDYQLYDLTEFVSLSSRIEPQDLENSARELEDLGFVELQYYSAIPTAGPRHGLPFALVDLLDYDPKQDILRVAKALSAGQRMGGDELRESTGLDVLRLNRSVLQIKQEDLADVSQTNGTAPYAFDEIRPTHRTRRLLREYADRVL
jgi:TIR domain